VRENAITADSLTPFIGLTMNEEESAQVSEVRDLTTRMAKGDEAAWREFERRYFTRLLRYLIVVTGGREEAAREALQSALLRVVRYVKPLATEEIFWGWLTVVARSCVVDEQRRRTRYFALLERFFQRRQIDEAALQPPPAGAPTDLVALLEQNLTTLSVDERALVERKYFARQPIRAIAGEMATTEKAVESRLVRIRAKLHDAILKQLKHEKSS